MDEKFRVGRPRASGSPGDTKEAGARPRAVFVAHGMGQQVAFETLDQVARGLCGLIERSGATVVRTARTVRVGCETLQRLELDVQSKEGKTLRPIHLYEAYWAPLTEGVVGLWQVVRFLLSGAFNGLRSDARLHRYMFGRRRQFHVSRWGLTQLGAVVITLIGVIIIGGTIPGAVIARFLLLRGNVVFAKLTTLFELLLSVITGAAAVAVVLAFVSRVVKRWWLKVACFISALTVLPVLVVIAAVWISAYVAIPAIVVFNKEMPISARQAEFRVWLALAVAGVLLLVYAVQTLVPRKGNRRNRGGRFTAIVLALLALAGIFALRGQSNALAVVTWLLLFGAVLFVRSFLIQYVGDVAIYVSPHVVDRFFDLRIRIKSVVRRAARAVYACRGEDGKFLYDGVVVVGHSLGSVVVYDALNRLLNEDMLSDAVTPLTCEGEPLENLQVCERTRRLLTFGSPLDKTAFVFAQHDLNGGSERDALAAAVQPLICDERKFQWLNLWTPFDILGGHLDFYDTPDRSGEPNPNKRRVRNLVDWKAITPFAAHTELWGNELLYRAIYHALR